jgi:hypothetical protein
VLATNFTNEGEATAHYIGEMLTARGLKVTRLARGVRSAASSSTSTAAPSRRRCGTGGRWAPDTRLKAWTFRKGAS